MELKYEYQIRLLKGLSFFKESFSSLSKFKYLRINKKIYIKIIKAFKNKKKLIISHHLLCSSQIIEFLITHAIFI